MVSGGIYAAWANALPQLAASTAPLKELAPWAAITATGWSKLFGTPGIAAAMYVTTRPQNRRRLLALLVPATLTAVLCGVTEPLEFTFLFVAPPLFVMHVAADDEFVRAGAVGVMRRGQALQVVVGLSVATVLERLCDLIEG